MIRQLGKTTSFQEKLVSGLKKTFSLPNYLQRSLLKQEQQQPQLQRSATMVEKGNNNNIYEHFNKVRKIQDIFDIPNIFIVIETMNVNILFPRDLDETDFKITALKYAIINKKCIFIDFSKEHLQQQIEYKTDYHYKYEIDINKKDEILKKYKKNIDNKQLNNWDIVFNVKIDGEYHYVIFHNTKNCNDDTLKEIFLNIEKTIFYYLKEALETRILIPINLLTIILHYKIYNNIFDNDNFYDKCDEKNADLLVKLQKDFADFKNDYIEKYKNKFRELYEKEINIDSIDIYDDFIKEHINYFLKIKEKELFIDFIRALISYHDMKTNNDEKMHLISNIFAVNIIKLLYYKLYKLTLLDKELRDKLIDNVDPNIKGGSVVKYQLFISNKNKYFIYYYNKRIYLKISNIQVKNNKLYLIVNNKKLLIYW
jgi:hypothetical protein